VNKKNVLVQCSFCHGNPEFSVTCTVAQFVIMLAKQLKYFTFSSCVWSIVVSNGDGIIIII